MKGLRLSEIKLILSSEGSPRRYIRNQEGRCWRVFFFSSSFIPPLFLFWSISESGRCEHLSTRSCHAGWTSCRRQQQQQQQPVVLPEPHAKRPPVPGQAEGGAAAHAGRGPRWVLPLLLHLKSHDIIFHHRFSLQQRVTNLFISLYEQIFLLWLHYFIVLFLFFLIIILILYYFFFISILILYIIK